VGGFLVAVAAIIVFAASLRGSSGGQRYVVAAQSLGSGTVIAPSDLTTANMQLPSTSRRLAFGQTGLLIGRTLAVPVDPGELMESSMLTPAGPQSSLRPISVAVDANSLAGLASGQSVDVLATTGTGTAAQVAVVMRGAELINLNRPGAGVLSGPSTEVLATLGVTTLSEVEAIVQASQAGTITLVAARPSDGVGPGPGS
jgi:Flp pilus assembly protein CpaB